MVHWIRLPIALAPDRSYDRNGIFSGSVTIVDGVPTIVYTGITEEQRQVQCLAMPANLSDPALTNWTKSVDNPRITEPDGRDPSTAFRDEANNYYLIYGYGSQELGGQAVLFTSKDFFTWSYVHPLHSNHYDTFWECPDIFNVSGRVVLKASLLGRDFWTLGEFDWARLVFTPSDRDVGEFVQLIDHGKFYASKTFYDPRADRQIIMGWTAEEDNRGPERDWQGLHTLPRMISLSNDGRELRSRPIEALNTLRNLSSHWSRDDIVVQPFALLPDVEGNQIEIQLTWQFPAHEVNSIVSRFSSTDPAE